MKKIFILLLALAISPSINAMLARARGPVRPQMLSTIKQVRESNPPLSRQRSYKSVRLEGQKYPKTTKFWDPWKTDENGCFRGFKEVPVPEKSYGQMGKHIFCQLVALHIIHERHMQRHRKTKGIGLEPQVETDDRLLFAIDLFSDTFINPDPATNRFSRIFEDGQIPTITDEELVTEIQAALKNLEKFLTDPKNKL